MLLFLVLRMIDASSNEDKVEMPQPYTNSPLQDNGI
jgi:hypothetical protein